MIFSEYEMMINMKNNINTDGHEEPETPWFDA